MEKSAKAVQTFCTFSDQLALLGQHFHKVLTSYKDKHSYPLKQEMFQDKFLSPSSVWVHIFLIRPYKTSQGENNAYSLLLAVVWTTD